MDDERDDETTEEPAVDDAPMVDEGAPDTPASQETTDDAPGAPVDVPGPDPDAPDSGEVEDESVLPPAALRAIVEALVFAAPQPLTAREIGRVLQGVPKEDWQQALEELKKDYARDDRGLQLIEVASGWQITTRPEYNDWVRELLDPRTPTRLSIQALETLSVIAYRQPVTLPEIIELRGVRSQGVVKTLLEKRLIRITGRKEVVGRPMLYGTTKQFLLHFGLKDLEELPQIEEFAEVLGEEVDIPGLKKAIEAPRPAEVPLSEGDGEGQGTLFDEGGEGPDDTAEGETAEDESQDDEELGGGDEDDGEDDDAAGGVADGEDEAGDDEYEDEDEDEDEDDEEDEDEEGEDDPDREP